MKYNPNPEKGDTVRARIDGKVVEVKYLEPFNTNKKMHWVGINGEIYFLPHGKNRFVYPIEQMGNYKRKDV